MLYMVIEHFQGSDPLPVYRRLRDAGRDLPDGLRYVDSWMEVGLGRCFQLMETDDPALFQTWALHRTGCGVTFEVVPVITSARTQAAVAPLRSANRT
ncbi:hypothetical protein GCM10011360_18110 [Primorskyibacter flagellatus]|uniref:DUF3303 domain-containing protein n=1 Tax=Primorskyibacter flagellatus TaxID=1387277 RepID=A0A917EGA8_9RHOB|nr:DUF3303 family protein [Primorskyibacter flagellatus]GGE30478.1 hypothetical protein GCM10011360_18110 [Primorskyibacter flagellatus]